MFNVLLLCYALRMASAFGTKTFLTGSTSNIQSLNDHRSILQPWTMKGDPYGANLISSNLLINGGNLHPIFKSLMDRIWYVASSSSHSPSSSNSSLIWFIWTPEISLSSSRRTMEKFSDRKKKYKHITPVPAQMCQMALSSVHPTIMRENLHRENNSNHKNNSRIERESSLSAHSFQPACMKALE